MRKLRHRVRVLMQLGSAKLGLSLDFLPLSYPCDHGRAPPLTTDRDCLRVLTENIKAEWSDRLFPGNAML